MGEPTAEMGSDDPESRGGEWGPAYGSALLTAPLAPKLKREDKGA